MGYPLYVLYPRPPTGGVSPLLPVNMCLLPVHIGLYNYSA